MKKNNWILIGNFLLVIVCVFAADPAQAVSYIGGTYTQDFNGLGTGTSLTPAADWSVWSIGNAPADWNATNGGIAANGAIGSETVQRMNEFTGTTQDTRPIYSAFIDTAITSDTAYKNDQAFNIYHTSGDQVLSTSPTGNAGTALQLLLTNDTNSIITSLKLSYDIIKFHNGFSTGSSPYLEELPGYQLFYAIGSTSSTWYNISTLNPVNTADGIHPVVPVGGAGYLEVPVQNALVNLSTSWGNGQNLYLRWVDDNAVTLSADQIIGLDNVNVSAVPIPAAAWLLGTGLVGLVALRRRKR